MAAVHLGRMVGTAGFGRVVAIKRMHAHLAEDRQFVGMFLDEARIAARVGHPNVVTVLDVFSENGELFIVLEYVHGESLAGLTRELMAHEEAVPVEIAASIAIGMLAGLHAAHEATTEARQPLGIIHRDVSPHNVMLGADGVARVMDFGIAKAAGRSHKTQTGELKGKLAYMAPEQLKGEELDRRTDIWAASVVLWELLTGRRLFHGDEAGVVFDILERPLEPPSRHAPQAARLDAVVMRGLARPRDQRFRTALEMLEAIEDACGVATSRQVARWADTYLAPILQYRTALLASIETANPSAPPLTGLHAVPAITGPPAAPIPAPQFLPPASAPVPSVMRLAPTAPVVAPMQSWQSVAPVPGARRKRRVWPFFLTAILTLIGIGAGLWMLGGTKKSKRTPKPAKTSVAAGPTTSAPATAAPIATTSASAQAGPALGDYCAAGSVCRALVAPDPSKLSLLSLIEQSRSLVLTVDPAATLITVLFYAKVTGLGIDLTQERASGNIQYSTPAGTINVLLADTGAGWMLMAMNPSKATSMLPPQLPPPCPFDRALAQAQASGVGSSAMQIGYMNIPMQGSTWMFVGDKKTVNIDASCSVSNR